MIRAAIIGLSWIGADPPGAASDGVLGTAVPYSHASALAAIADATVVAVCDTDAAALEAFHKRWHHRWPGVRTYQDVPTMLSDQPLDLVCIATPDHLHVDIAVAAMTAGVRMIFCEKPLAIELEDADRLIQVAESTATTINVNYTRRWLPEFVEARAQVRAGAIGELSQVICQTGGPRAMLFRNLTHLLDLMCYFAESDPVWVMAELEPGYETYGTRYRGDGGRDPASEPGAHAHVVFANGVRGTLSGTKRQPPGELLQLLGREGRIVIDSDGARISVPSAEGVVSRRLLPRFTRAGMSAGIVDLITAHQTSTIPASPPRDARRSVAMALAVLRSQAAGNVRVPVFPSDGS